MKLNRDGYPEKEVWELEEDPRVVKLRRKAAQKERDLLRRLTRESREFKFLLNRVEYDEAGLPIRVDD